MVIDIMRVIKRKIGRNSYNYLQHSFRDKGRVKTAEIYLGKAIPEDIDIIKKEFSDRIIKETLSESLDVVRVGFKKEWLHYPESVREKIKEQLAEVFTYNTNAIEGSTITLEETREIIEHNIAPNKPLRDIKETEAHAAEFLRMLEKKEKPDISLILRWHNRLFGDTKKDIAGMFREHLIRVGDYVAPDWQDVKKLMGNLIDFYNQNKRKMGAVELAARMHYKFEKIHPFGDGNGRVGRLMMNYILWHDGYPMLIIEYKKRKAYYHALKKDEDYFFHYFVRRFLRAHKKYL